MIAGIARPLLPAAAAMLLILPARAQAPQTRPAADRELTVTNRAAQPMTELHVSPSRTDDWGADRLGTAAPLKPGASFRVRLGRGEDCSFDVMAVYADGSQEEAAGADACRQKRLALDGSGAHGRPDGGAAHAVIVRNAAPIDIQSVFISPSATDSWGDDRLDADALAPGGEARLSYQGACDADLRVVFENRAAEERRGLDLCAHPVVAIAPGWTTGDAPGRNEPGRDEPGSDDAGAAPPGAGGDAGAGRVLVLSNRTGHVIDEAYTYPDGATDPGADLLGRAVVADGAEAVLPIGAGGSRCRYTLRLVFQGDVPDLLRPGVDLCAVRRLTVGGP